MADPLAIPNGTTGGSAAPLLDRGTWAATTAYAVSDVVTTAGLRYVCKTAHTSAGSFSGTSWVALDAAAILAVGTTTGTVAAGDDSRITGAAVATTVTTALALKADLASPALTGNPTAPTASPGDNDTSVATTAFVTAAAAVVTTASAQKSANLSDLTAATARGNLGLGSFSGSLLAMKGALDSGSSGTYRANMFRQEAITNLTALTSGIMTSVLVYLEAGDVVTNLTFFSGTTAAVTPTAWWFALYSPAATPALLAQTADQTTAAWAANGVKTLALASPYTVVTTGLHYASVMVTAATVPSLRGISMTISGIGAPLISGQKNLALTSGSALTTTAPPTITSSSATAALPIAVAS